MSQSSEQTAVVPDWVLAGVSSDSTRPMLMVPWEFDWKGERWTIATDDRFAILARGCFGAQDADAPDSGAPKFLNILAYPPDAERHEFEVSALRSWVGYDRIVPTCDNCNGTPEWECTDCNGIGDTECECECGNVHHNDCKTCHGSGMEKCPVCFPSSREKERGIVFGQPFNLKLLRRAISKLPFEKATWVHSAAHAEKCAWIEGDDWRILVMPMHLEGPHAELPSFPSSTVTA
jgi:hypothetical protein